MGATMARVIADGREHQAVCEITFCLDTNNLREWCEVKARFLEPHAWKTFDMGQIVSVISDDGAIPAWPDKLKVVGIMAEEEYSEIRLRSVE